MMVSRRCILCPSLLLLAATAATGCGHAPHQLDPAPRRSATSVQSLSEKDFGGQRVTRVEELFAGRFPGVEVFNAPGGLQIRVRGQTTINGDSEPLFVVDGTPLAPGTGGLIAINPQDVARIEVLKDAVSTAEYGLRGANGVIRITTKR